jgi:hypothetical protein
MRNSIVISLGTTALQTRLRDLRRMSPALLRAILLATLAAGSATAHAETGPDYTLALPIPQAILSELDLDAPAEPAPAVTPEENAAVTFEPDLTRAAIRTAASHTHPRARRPVPIDIIRSGLSARAQTTGSLPERAVGLRLGADIFSVTTRVVAPSGQEYGRDARIDWRLARPIDRTGAGWIWTVSAQGGAGFAAHTEQGANVLVGYRHEFFEHLTLTSQVTMAGNYVFAPDGGLSSSFIPEVKLSANLTPLARLPWETELDLALARKVPLAASEFETRGSAMLRLKYILQ